MKIGLSPKLLLKSPPPLWTGDKEKQTNLFPQCLHVVIRTNTYLHAGQHFVESLPQVLVQHAGDVGDQRRPRQKLEDFGQNRLVRHGASGGRHEHVHERHQLHLLVIFAAVAAVAAVRVVRVDPLWRVDADEGGDGEELLEGSAAHGRGEVEKPRLGVR